MQGRTDVGRLTRADAKTPIPSTPMLDAAAGMNFLHRYLFAAMWIGWALYWWLLSRNVKRETQREPVVSRLAHMLPLILAALLLWSNRMPVWLLGDRFLPRAEWTFVVGALLTAAGLLFSVWARVHIGRNWSGIVTIKEDHELVTSGPYAIVRHPIYTGLLLGFIGSALARGEWRGVLAVAIVLVALWRKLRVEEQFMQQQFGDAYRQYASRVPALAPRIW
jgi:protein-S-isoprenylcysteine O-methyltransferase Ste14